MVKRTKKITALFLILSSLMLFCGGNVFADYKYEPIEDCIAAVNGINNSSTEYYQLTQKELTAVERVLEYDNERSVNGSQNVTGIKFNATSIVMAVGDTSDALIATLTPKNGLGGRLTWYSSDTSVITVDRNGRITAKGTGNAAAFAESENGIITVCGVYVLPYTEISERLKLSSKAYEYEVGSKFYIDADYSGYYSPSGRIIWSVSDTSAVIGEPAIYGYLGYNGTFVYKGESQKYSYKKSTLRGCNVYSAVKPGTVVITGKAPTGSQDSVTVTIKPKDTGVTVSPSTASLKVGESLSLTAEVAPANAFNRSVTWTSSDESIAAVDPNGLVTAAGAGRAVITATSANGHTASAEINVAEKEKELTYFNIRLSTDQPKYSSSIPTSVSTAKTYTMVADKEPSDVTAAVNWSSSDTSIAEISADGVVTAHKAGNVTITATCQNMTDTYKLLFVTPTLELNSPNNISVYQGKTYQLDYTTTADDIKASSLDTSVATISDTGLITGVSPGTTLVQIYSGSAGKCIGINVEVKAPVVEVTQVVMTPTSKTINVSETFTLSAQVLPDNAADKSLLWLTSNASVAAVDQNGKVTGISAGTAFIYARSSNAKSAMCTVTVTQNNEPTQIQMYLNSNNTMMPGQSIALTVQILPDAAADTKLTFTSSDPSVAAVSSTGKVTSYSVGSTVITAAAPNGVSKSITIYVEDPEPDTLIVPNYLYVKAGETVPIIHSCSPSGTTFTYTTSDDSSNYFTINTTNNTVTGIAPTTASINISASNGLKAGFYIIVLDKDFKSASYLRMPSQYSKEVNDIFGIEVESDIASSKQHQTWVSSNPDVAAVYNGIVTCRKEGTAKITCRVPGGRSAETTVYVGSASSHPQSAITLNQETEIYLKTGEYFDLDYTVSPSSEAAYVSVYTNNQGAVSVNGNRVYGKIFGMATVYITPKNGTKKAITVYVDPTEEEQEAARIKYASDLLYYVNIERGKEGLPALTTNPELTALAQIRADECTVLYSHTRPDGSQWYTVFKDYSISTSSKGENLMAGRGYSPAEYVEGWMSSETHRKNIMNVKFNTTGIGVVPCWDYYDCSFTAYYAAELFTS